MNKRFYLACGLVLTVLTTAVWAGGGKTITASDNAYVLNGSGDQSEASSLTIRGTSRLAYLRFDTAGLSLGSEDLVYLDLYLTPQESSHAELIRVAALNDGTPGETTWNSTMTYAARPDGTTGPTNANTTAVATYHGRVASWNSAEGQVSPSSPPGQGAIVISNSVMRSLLADDMNGELTLILYGASSDIYASSLGSTNLHPQLRIIRKARVETIPESSYGGYYRSDNTSWNDTGTNGIAGRVYNASTHFLLFQLPRRPKTGFAPGDTSLEATLLSQNSRSGSDWNRILADAWAVGYVPAGDVPLTAGDVSGHHLIGNTENKAGMNLGTNLTVKLCDTFASFYSIANDRYALAPDACETLTAFINDLFDNHGAKARDYVVLRLCGDNAAAVNGTAYQFYTGNAAANQKPVLTLSAEPSGTVITLY
jgi:hypothetical protein